MHSFLSCLHISSAAESAWQIVANNRWSIMSVCAENGPLGRYQDQCLFWIHGDCTWLSITKWTHSPSQNNTFTFVVECDNRISKISNRNNVDEYRKIDMYGPVIRSGTNYTTRSLSPQIWLPFADNFVKQVDRNSYDRCACDCVHDMTIEAICHRVQNKSQSDHGVTL